MTVRILAVPLLVLALAAPASVHAQGSEPPATIAIVEQFVDVAHLNALFDSSVETMLKAQIQQSPELAPYEDIMRDFLKKYMSFEGVKPELVKLYQVNFSDTDLLAAIAFYRTPAGQRILSKTPELMAGGAAIGEQRVKDHLPELVELIQARQAAEPPAVQN
jgi:uncharacterized protein